MQYIRYTHYCSQNISFQKTNGAVQNRPVVLQGIELAKNYGKPISTTTINDLCTFLDCNVENILVYLKK